MHTICKRILINEKKYSAKDKFTESPFVTGIQKKKSVAPALNYRFNFLRTMEIYTQSLLNELFRRLPTAVQIHAAGSFFEIL